MGGRAAVRELDVVESGTEKALDRLPLRGDLAAVNLEHVDLGHVLVDGDELALLPPLAGG